jgi:hypothetical protein
MKGLFTNSLIYSQDLCQQHLNFNFTFEVLEITVF